ncbi:MAG: hypothetical protein HC942_25210 [Microcoleus sp. SU_5_6]|nr:hypothetical protein [Microcoleus sp. SU_5_6]
MIVKNIELFTDENRIVCKWPDWMYVKPVNPQDASHVRRSYTPHTEGSVPLIAIEFLVEDYRDEFSNESVEGVGKWFFYEWVIKIPIYRVLVWCAVRTLQLIIINTMLIELLDRINWEKDRH